MLTSIEALSPAFGSSFSCRAEDRPSLSVFSFDFCVLSVFFLVWFRFLFWQNFGWFGQFMIWLSSVFVFLLVSLSFLRYESMSPYVGFAVCCSLVLSIGRKIRKDSLVVFLHHFMQRVVLFDTGVKGPGGALPLTQRNQKAQKQRAPSGFSMPCFDGSNWTSRSSEENKKLWRISSNFSCIFHIFKAIILVFKRRNESDHTSAPPPQPELIPSN